MKPIETRNYGMHLMIDGYGANSHHLEDISLIFSTLNDLPGRIGMNKIGFPHLAEFKEGDISGVTGIMMITESHISIHTYSKRDFLTMDIYSCKPFDTKMVVDFITERFELKDSEVHIIDRGTRFPINNTHE